MPTQCAYDGCMLTGDVQKEKYVYYRCTGHRGKCELPRFREEGIANRLGEPLKALQVPQEVVSRIVYSLYVSQDSTEKAKLLKMLFSSCSVDAVSVPPTYRNPFDMIFKRAISEEWSGRLDSN